MISFASYFLAEQSATDVGAGSALLGLLIVGVVALVAWGAVSILERGNGVAVPALPIESAADGNADAADGNCYSCAESLLTKPERSLYEVLLQAVRGRWEVQAKVRLADAVHVRKGVRGKAYLSALNAIKTKHLDFVLCEPGTLRIVAAVEMDDGRQEQFARDERKADILAEAGIWLLRVPVCPDYTLREVSDLLAPLNRETPPEPELAMA
jgi:hypothetical protein